MSVRLMAAVFELDIPATEKLVLLAMADHARDDGTGCYPSIELLARKTSQSRRGVQKIMRRLEQGGLIIPSEISQGRRSTEYRITLANREQGSLFAPAQPRTAMHPTANLSAPNREAGSPEPLGTVIEPTPQPSAAASGGDGHCPGSGQRSGKPTDARYQPFLGFVRQSYLRTFGRKPTLLPKDFKQITSLLRAAQEERLEELQRRYEFFLRSTDDFLRRNGHALWLFCARFDGLRDGPILQQNGGTNTNEKLKGNELLKHNLAAAGFQNP